eukprot:1220024-Rhodomonas_salina.1
MTTTTTTTTTTRTKGTVCGSWRSIWTAWTAKKVLWREKVPREAEQREPKRIEQKKEAAPPVNAVSAMAKQLKDMQKKMDSMLQ